MALNPNPPQGVIKGQAVIVLDHEQRNVLSDVAVDCRDANAVLVQVFVTGGSTGADLDVEGAPERGGPYLPLPDPSARQTGVASNTSFDVVVGARWVKIRVKNRTDGVFTVYVTPYQSPGATQVSITATASQNLAQVGGASVSLGQKAMASSIPVVVASDQSAVATQLSDGSNPIGVAGNPLRVDPTGTTAQPIAGTGPMGAATPDVNDGIAADVDAAVAGASGLRLMGFSCRESAATPAAATFKIVHGATVAGGTGIIPVELAGDESQAHWFGPDGIAVPNGLSIDHVAGTIDVVLFTKIV